MTSAGAVPETWSRTGGDDAWATLARTGTAIAAAFGCVAFGDAVGDSLPDHALTPVWGVARVPLALVLTAAAVASLFRWCPARRQPGWSLALGAAVAVGLWTAATVALNLAYRAVPALGDAYGPLAGVVALLVWSFSSSVALLHGGAVAAHLEALRAAAEVPAPQGGRTEVAWSRRPSAAAAGAHGAGAGG